MKPAWSAFRLLTAIIVGVLLLELFPPTGFAAGTEDQLTINSVDSSGYPKISFRMTLSNPRGAPIPPLSPSNFVVQEDGQSVGSVAAYALAGSPTPLSVVMAVDISGSMNDEGKLTGAKTAAKTFIESLRPIDRVEVVAFSDKVTTVVPFTTNHAVLDRGIDGLKANGNTLLYDGTNLAVNDVLRTSGTRFVIVLTDGEDTASGASLSDVLGHARQSQIPIYTIGLGGDVKDAVLSRMAADTAGKYFKAPKASDLEAVFLLLSDQLQHEYELYYFSPTQSNKDMMGKKLNVAIKVQGQSKGVDVPQLDGTFSYSVPTVAQFDPGVVDPGQLRSVPQPAAPAPPPLPGFSFPPVLAALFAFVGVLCALGGLGLRLGSDPLDSRMATFVSGIGRAIRLPDDQPGGQLGRALLESVARGVGRMLPASQIEAMRLSLLQAGSPNGWNVQEFIGLRIVSIVGLGALGYLLGVRQGPTGTLLYTAGMAGLGFIMPVIWLSGRIKARQREIFRAMPNALDLIAVSVQAGLGFDQAVSEVCAKWQNDLTHEFTRFLAEIRVGRSRHDALRGIVERTGVQELSGFVTAVIQADELGAGIADTLAIQAEQIRMKRRQHAERLAHEAAIKMIFPLVFLMFPAIFVVLLGPSVPIFLDTFSHLGK